MSPGSEPVEAVAEAAWDEAVVEAVAEADEVGPDTQPAEPVEAVAEAAWDEAVVEAASETFVVASLGADHAAWERDFQIVARHAQWDEQFAATTTPVDGGSFVADVAVTGSSEAADDGWDQPTAEPEVAVAEAPSAGSEPIARSRRQEQPVAEATWEEPLAEAPQEQPVAEDASVELVAEEELVEAVAEATWEEPLAEGDTVGGSEWDQPVSDSVGSEIGSEVLAAAAPVEAPPETVDAVAEVELETVEAIAGPDAAWDSPVAGSDDIWYSGAPDDELPAAELLSGEPVGVAPGTERAESFVWIPAEDERG